MSNLIFYGTCIIGGAISAAAGWNLKKWQYWLIALPIIITLAYIWSGKI